MSASHSSAVVSCSVHADTGRFLAQQDADERYSDRFDALLADLEAQAQDSRIRDALSDILVEMTDRLSWCRSDPAIQLARFTRLASKYESALRAHLERQDSERNAP